MKVSNFLISIIILILLGEFIYSQQDEIVVLSRKVGATLDAEEKEILGLFPEIDGFQSAQFFELDNNKYLVKIVYLDHTRPRIKKKRLSWIEFKKLKMIADRHPEITEEMRAELRYRLSYLSVNEMLESIPSFTFCTIRHSNGRRITGNFVEYKNKTIFFQAPTSRIQIPITEIESISYRPYIENENTMKKMLTFAASALLGFGIGELWNLQSRPVVDITWHNRFVGAILGIIAGGELFEAVSILTSPRKFIAFTPEEVAKLKD